MNEAIGRARRQEHEKLRARPGGSAYGDQVSIPEALDH